MGGPYTPHTCRCTNCFDYKLPKAVQRPGHVAFRFGNTVSQMTVSLDEKDVTRDCIEAYPGPEGYVVAYPLDASGRRHYCLSCNRRICTAVLKGQVVVRNGDEVFA